MFNRINLCILFLALFLSGWVIEADATTTNLANCSQATVSSAITAATAGDTLVCPAGSWTWTGVVIILSCIQINTIYDPWPTA